MGSQRVGHDWSDLAHAHICITESRRCIAEINIVNELHFSKITLKQKSKALKIFLYKSFCEHTFPFLMGKHLGMELLGHRAGVCWFYKKPPDICPSGCTILHSHQQCENARYLTPSSADVSVCLFPIWATELDSRRCLNRCWFALRPPPPPWPGLFHVFRGYLGIFLWDAFSQSVGVLKFFGNVFWWDVF